LSGLLIGVILFAILGISVYTSDRWVPYFFPEDNNATAQSGGNNILRPVVNEIDPRQTVELIHRYVNEERTSRGLAALDWDDRLADVAQSHSAAMAQFGFFDHIDQNGKSPVDRYRDNGISCRGAENLTLGGSAYGDMSAQDIAQGAVDAWMSSTQGHRENILDDGFTQEGIGIAFNSAGDTAYITQNFC
jgi:uncharacterized protein YkwD